MSVSLPYPYPSEIGNQWEPYSLLRNLQYLAEQIDTIPSGTIILMISGSACPAGFTKHSTSNGSYLRLSTGSAGGTGGSGTSGAGSGHSHTFTTGGPSNDVLVTEILSPTAGVATEFHSHSGATSTESTHTHSVTPTYVDVILCVKN